VTVFGASNRSTMGIYSTNMSFYSPFTAQWFLYGIFFVASVFVSCTIPGSILVKGLKLPRLANLLVSTILGMVLWAWQGILFGYLNHRELTYIYLVLTTGFWLATSGWKNLPGISDLNSLRRKPFFLFVGIAGSILLHIPLFINGMVTKNGVLFCCTSDSFWYLSLADILIRKFPPDTPGLNGIPLTNYHYFFLMIVAELVRIFKLPLMPTVFQYIRILFGFLYAASGFVLISSLTKHSLAKKLFFFFLFFSADLLYVLGFLFSGKMSFDYTPIYISQKMLFNMPMASATVLFFTVLYLLHFVSWKIKPAAILPIAILIGSSIGFKTYVGLVLLFGLLLLAVFDVIRKKSFGSLAVFILSGCIAAAAFIPVNKGAGGLYPSWFFKFEELMSFPVMHFDAKTLEWVSFWTKQKRLLHAPLTTIVPVLGWELVFAVVYMISVFGTTALGFLYVRRERFTLFLYGMTVISVILGTVFMQTTGGGHTYNFLIVAYLILMIMTSLFLGKWMEGTKRKWMVAVVIGMVILLNGIPTLATILHFTGIPQKDELFVLTWKEQEAIAFLAKQKPTGEFVMVDPDNELDYVTPYLSAFIKQPLYMSGPYIVSALNLPYQKRLAVAKQIMNESDAMVVKKLMAEEHIRYVYVKNSTDPMVSLYYSRIFDAAFRNSEVTIYKAKYCNCEPN
jgi:hypothetical protein